MAEPQVQYCTTADGVSIAYYVMGEGPPIVSASSIWGSHLLLGRSRNRQHAEAWERRHRVVRYDGRGSGLSQRESPDFSLAARLLDLEAVADRQRIERFALAASYTGGFAAVAYAVRHPERVSHLILMSAYASGRDFYEASPVGRARTTLRPATRDEWEFYTQTSATWDFGFSDAERAKGQAALYLASMEYAAFLPWRDATLEIDMTDVLPQIRMPTLVLCRPQPQYSQPELSQVVASRIPDARLVVLGPRTDTGVDEEWLRAIEEFLGGAASADEAGEASKAAVAPREGAGAFRTILFTDIVGHTEMMQRLGDAKGREVLRDHERITREALKQHGGVEVKTDGDSFMATFTSPSGAVECAIALQRAFAEHGEAGGEPIVVRMGLNVGEPIEEEGDFFGSAVILGARIKDQAGGGEVLVPEAVRHMLAGKKFVFADRGAFALKGFEDAVRLYEVWWREGGA